MSGAQEVSYFNNTDRSLETKSIIGVANWDNK